MRPSHLLCIDFESWIFSRRIAAQNLTDKELKKLDNNYTPKSLRYLLKTLKRHNQKVTFFVVTKLEELYPGILDTIISEGHEVGWHTHTHPNVDSISTLEAELDAAKKIIKKYKMKGFQAPSITFSKKGYKVLKRYGFEYSSSTYGNASLVYEYDGIFEIPVSTHKSNYFPKKNEVVFPSTMSISNIKKYGFPVGSSFFWGVLGKQYYLKKIKKEEEMGRIFNTFIHEWQIIRPQAAEYKKDVGFLRNPLFFPYKIDVPHIFENLLEYNNFQRCYDYINYVKAKKR